MRKRLTAALLIGSLMGVGHAQVTYTAQGVPTSGSVIQNTGVLTGQNDDGTPMSVSSNTVSATVTQVAGVDIQPDGDTSSPGQTETVAPDETAVFTYTLTNTGNGQDTFNLDFDIGSFQAAYVSPIFVDTNANGIFDQDGSDQQITDITLQGGEEARLFIPVLRNYGANMGIPGESNDFTLTATSNFDSNVSDASVSRLINAALANFNMGYDSYVKVRVGQEVINDLAIFNAGNVALTTNFRLNEIQAAASDTRYNAGYGEFSTPQEAFDAYLAANPGGIAVGGHLRIDTINRLNSANGGQPALTKVQAYTTEPAPGRNTFTSSAPANLDYQVTIGNANLQGHKEQAACAVNSFGGLGCSTTTYAPIDLPPCGIVYYRVRAQSLGDVEIGDLTITDVVPSNLELLWGRARTYQMFSPATETSAGNGRLIGNSLISVNGGPEILGSININAPGSEVKAYPTDLFGNKTDLKPNHELWLELFARVPGDNCPQVTTPFPDSVSAPTELTSS